LLNLRQKKTTSYPRCLPKAGGRREGRSPPSHPKYEKIEKEFTEKEGPKNAKNLAKRAIEEGFDRIIIVGGDGLLNEGVNGIMEATEKISQNFAIGIIPTGAGNNFAKEIGIPRDIEKAFEIIRKDKNISVDVGKINNRFFINCASFGFDGLVNKLANELKEKYQFLPRPGSYLFAALKEIIKKIPIFEIKIKGEEIDLKEKVVMAAITNSQSYGTIFKINPGALVNDQKLNLCLISEVGRMRALSDILGVIRGNHSNLPEVKMLKFSSPLTISSPEILPYEIDGEVPEPEKEYQISILPKALKILVP